MMIKVGSIVYRMRSKGLINSTIADRTDKTDLGLVIDEFKEKASIPQYRVLFPKETPKWFYQHQLCPPLSGPTDSDPDTR